MRKFTPPIGSTCNVCNRQAIRLTYYNFNEPKQIVNWDTTQIIKDNPHALQITLCGTDLNLIARIKRESGSKMSPTQILDKAREYRKMKPIRRV